MRENQQSDPTFWTKPRECRAGLRAATKTCPSTPPHTLPSHLLQAACFCAATGSVFEHCYRVRVRLPHSYVEGLTPQRQQVEGGPWEL